MEPKFELTVGTNLHLNPIKLDDNEHAIVGLGGDELDVKWNLEKLDSILSAKKFKNLILVSHIPPFGFCDYAVEGKHVGSKPLRTLIENHEPKLSIFGHIHEDSGKSAMLNEIRFWNVGPKGILINL